MSASQLHSSSRRAAPSRYSRHRTRRAAKRRRSGLLLLAAIVVIVGWAITRLDNAVQHLTLPLADVGVIRHEAASKHLDPALIAAVIYAETKFDPRPSPAGAQGLMQILPSTAHFVAHLSGGVSFQTADLATPAINVAYGSYYLRYLLDHYGGQEMLAVAAYNAGLANVDKWAARARAEGGQLTIEAIPFPETREYVRRVLDAQQAYRSTYAQQLGID